MLEQLLLKEKLKKPSPFSPPYINYSSSYLYQRRLYIYKLILAHVIGVLLSTPFQPYYRLEILRYEDTVLLYLQLLYFLSST